VTVVDELYVAFSNSSGKFLTIELLIINYTGCAPAPAPAPELTPEKVSLTADEHLRELLRPVLTYTKLSSQQKVYISPGSHTNFATSQNYFQIINYT